MVALEKCEKILNSKRKTFNNDEIKAIREWLYRIAEIEYERYVQKEIKK